MLVVKEKSFIHLISYPKIEKKSSTPNPDMVTFNRLVNVLRTVQKCVLKQDKYFVAWRFSIKDGSMAFHLWITGPKSSALILSLQYSVIVPLGQDRRLTGSILITLLSFMHLYLCEEMQGLRHLSL